MSVWPRSSRMSTWRRADSTIASGVWPSFFSRSCASEPMLTPMRIGVSALDRQLDDLARLHRVGDVAGVEPQLRHAGLDRGQRHAVIEMDVGDDRDRRALHDVRQAGRVARILAGHAHDLAAFHRQAVDLLERLFVIGGVGRRHRLHRDRMIAADPNALGVGFTRLVLEKDRLGLAAQADHVFLLRPKTRPGPRDARDVVIGDRQHHHDQRREAADVNQRFLLGIDRLAAQHLDQDEDRRGRRRAPGSAAG